MVKLISTLSAQNASLTYPSMTNHIGGRYSRVVY